MSEDFYIFSHPLFKRFSAFRQVQVLKFDETGAFHPDFMGADKQILTVNIVPDIPLQYEVARRAEVSPVNIGGFQTGQHFNTVVKPDCIFFFLKQCFKKNFGS